MGTLCAEGCIVGIRVPNGGLVKAFDVCIKGEDIYVNYSDSSATEAHGSYHASGELHFKRKGATLSGMAGRQESLSL